MLERLTGHADAGGYIYTLIDTTGMEEGRSGPERGPETDPDGQGSRSAVNKLPGIDTEAGSSRRNVIVTTIYGVSGLLILGSLLPGDEESENGGEDGGEASTGGDESGDTPTATPEPSPTPEPTPTPTPEETPTPTAEERVEQTVADADYGTIKADIDDILDVEINDHFERDGRIINLDVRADGYWDADDTVETGVANAYRVSRALFTTFDDTVEVWTRTMADFTGSDGSESTQTAVEVYVDADSASEFEWDGMKDLVDLDAKNFLEAADAYQIHPSVCENADVVTQCSR